MKIEVRYQSRGGNTKAVAEIISKEFNVQAHSIAIPLNGYTDIMFLGGGVYEWRMDKSLHRFIENLDPNSVGQIVSFSTTGMMNSTINQIRQLAENKGIFVNQNELLLKMMLRGHSWLGLQSGNFTEKHRAEIQSFTKKIKKDIS